MKRKLSSLVAGILGLTVLIGSMLPVAAAADAGGNGLKISPVVTNLTVNPGQSQTVEVSVQNVTQSDVTLQVIVNDFTASSDESGTPALLLDPGQYAPSHSLKRFIGPIANITVAAGQAKTVPVVITVPKNAAGGGYYGAVRFAPVSASSSGSNVTLAASVGSLILVRVPGDFKEDLRLVGFNAASGASGSPSVIFTGSKGLVASIRFQNEGDVQEQPFGKILLEQGNKQIASFEVNDTTPRGNVLPASIRKFTVNLTKVGAFGKYTLVGNFGYGTNGQLISGKTTFYVIPIWAIIAVVLVIAIIAFFIFGFPRLMRRYNERVIRRASGRR